MLNENTKSGNITQEISKSKQEYSSQKVILENNSIKGNDIIIIRKSNAIYEQELGTATNPKTTEKQIIKEVSSKGQSNKQSIVELDEVHEHKILNVYDIGIDSSKNSDARDTSDDEICENSTERTVFNKNVLAPQNTHFDNSKFQKVF